MTEAEWLEATNPRRMEDVVERTASERKNRLFAVTCFRQIWETLDCEGDIIRAAVVVCEQLAEGLPASDEIASLFVKLKRLSYRRAARTGICWPDYAAESLISDDTSLFLRTSVSMTGGRGLWAAPDDLREKAQSNLLREIFGNPFRPIAVDLSWLTSDVVALANGIYQNRAFDRLPILADALQDAGCDNEDILNHCRQPSEHVRGCWVVDLLMGRE